jgi:hypothetical protein
MATQADLLGITSGFLHSFIGGLARAEDNERQLLVGAINQAVQQGTPEALSLLNPERLQRYGMADLLPMYHGFATAVKEKNDMAMRQLAAQTGLAESQQRVAAAVEEPTIQAAKQKAQLGGLELQQAELRQKFIDEDPKLAMLPEANIQSQIAARQADIRQGEERTKQGWAQLAEQKRAHDMANARAGQGNSVERIKAGILTELLKTDPEAAKSLAFPGFEAAADRKAKMLDDKFKAVAPRLSENMRTFNAVIEKEKTTAEKSGREPFTFKTEAEANNFLAQVTGSSALYNSFREQLSDNPIAKGEFPELPKFDVIKDPGWFGGTRAWKVVPKEVSLLEELKAIGVDPSLFGKPPAKGKTPTVEKPAPKAEGQSGRRLPPESRERRTEPR